MMPAPTTPICMRSVETEDLFQRRRPLVGDALLEQLRHRVLPAVVDLLARHVRARSLEVIRLEVAEDFVAVAEDRVVADASSTERVEHLGPDVPMRLHVLVDPVRADLQDEGAPLGHVSSSLVMSTISVRGPWTPSTRLSSMSDVADGPETNVIGRCGSMRSSASGSSSQICDSRTTQMWRSGTSVNARRPSSGPAVRTIVPLSAIAALQPVSAPSTWSSS